MKHLLIGAVAFSSVALADGRRPPLPPPPPPPAVVPPAPTFAPPPPAARPGQPRGGEVFTHDGLRSDARLDVRRGRALLMDFERAVARRDLPALRSIDLAFRAFVDQELAEARFERGQGRGAVHELISLQRQLESLEGRVGHFAMSQRRDVSQQAVAIAERDLEPGRRHGRDGYGRIAR